MKTLLSAVVALIAFTVLRADRDSARIIPRAIASSDGAYFMLVVPVSDRRINWMWTVYAMGDSGAFKEVWSSGGLYFREMFLSDDGRHVACVDSWPTGHTPKNDIVIAVYRENQLVKAYRPTEIISDHAKFRFSSSHYRWLAEWPPIIARRDALYFTTVEDKSYELDMKTGKLSLVVR